MISGDQQNILKSETLASIKQSFDFDLENDTNINGKVVSPENKIDVSQIPKSHDGKYTNADKEKCPFFQFSHNNTSDITNAGTKKDNMSEEKGEKKKDDKTKKIKGGCPFMSSSGKCKLYLLI